MLPAGGVGPVVETIHRDLVGRARRRLEGEQAGMIAAAAVVARHRREIRHGIARINRQQRLEGTANGAQRHQPLAGRGPGPPEGMAAGVARVVRFARLLGGVDIARIDNVAHAADRCCDWRTCRCSR